MITITGSYNKQYGTFTMHDPNPPYFSTTYFGYTLNEMKKRYRENNGLKGKHINWIILGLDKEKEKQNGIYM